MGNRTSLTDANGANITYVFDDNNRLRESHYPSTLVVFAYGANGNALRWWMQWTRALTPMTR